MARQRVSRKELKEPDQFITQTGVAFEWVQAHVREIVYGVVGLIILIGIIVGWNSWQSSRREQAAVMLHQALKLVEPPAPQAGQSPPPTVTPVDTDKVIEKLQEITTDYASTPAGAQAYWHLGHQYLAKGDAAAALSAYTKARDRFPKHQTLSYAMATLNVGQAQEATGACDQAITSYAAVQQMPVGWLQGEAYLGMGRCHELNGAKDEAIAVYDRALADERLASDVQDTINERLVRLQPPVVTPPVTKPKSEATPGTGASVDKSADPVPSATEPKVDVKPDSDASVSKTPDATSSVTEPTVQAKPGSDVSSGKIPDTAAPVSVPKAEVPSGIGAAVKKSTDTIPSVIPPQTEVRSEIDASAGKISDSTSSVMPKVEVPSSSEAPAATVTTVSQDAPATSISTSVSSEKPEVPTTVEKNMEAKPAQ